MADLELGARSQARAIRNMQESLEQGRLIFVFGAGNSIALINRVDINLSWKGLIQSGLDYATRRGVIGDAQKSNWAQHLGSIDIDDLLSTAEFVQRKLGAPSGDLYARWLDDVFRDLEIGNLELGKSIKILYESDALISTLNYDLLLEKCVGTKCVNMSDSSEVIRWLRRENQGILHLHGSFDKPISCVVGNTDYRATIQDELRDLLQRSISTQSRLVFIGCGQTFEDPNLSNLIKWMRENVGVAGLQHYALVRASEIAEKEADPAWRGFVDPVSYGDAYSDLSSFIEQTFGSVRKRTGASASKSSQNGSSDHETKALQEYRSYLIRDCGQMTIEGVKADFDTAQKRFDLEKLFVPLKVAAVPPEYPLSDPQREVKLKKWHEDNKEAKRFGEIFDSAKCVALLALPGGGKTMLLKRLAVAYSDDKRLGASDDKLPSLKMSAVLIRCREWKEYIHKPISTMLKHISDVTGIPNLDGFIDDILPLLKRGEVLLLVDGLDEIHNDAGRTLFVENLEKFLLEFPKIRLVVTSREAGFDLVAPAISRICKRWRVAPLEADAIKLLCSYWHTLMLNGLPQAEVEAQQVSSTILSNPALSNLASNPLMLTMLLVVKHGAGRLPPDRVKLYDRAVEILLNIWNIKGHDPLDLKEAVPQLACLAFEMMQRGKQTATRRELLEILENAREKIPQVTRYAKDTPDKFLTRVELRSSLLIQSGFLREGSEIVPFYQFRHLTFQEYLTAVAVVEGHYLSFTSKNTVLTPLKDYVSSPEWREVVPMAAVLARKQAEPLLQHLVDEGKKAYQETLTGQLSGDFIWSARHDNHPVISRIVQCLIEEAEGSTEVISEALWLSAYFAQGCQSDHDWRTLANGPFGFDLLDKAWSIYEKSEPSESNWIRNTLAVLCAIREGDKAENAGELITRLIKAINIGGAENLSKAFLTVCGCFWGGHRHTNVFDTAELSALLPHAGIHIASRNTPTQIAATWAWACLQQSANGPSPDCKALDQILSNWTALIERFDKDGSWGGLEAYAIGVALYLERGQWKPQLTSRMRNYVKSSIRKLHRKEETGPEKVEVLPGLIAIAFHSADIISDRELSNIIQKNSLAYSFPGKGNIAEHLANQLSLSPPGRKKHRVKASAPPASP